jgi:hypothetical protein
MKIGNLSRICVFTLISTTSAISVPAPVPLLSGTVTDQMGAVISRAVVIVHWDPSGSEVGLRDNVGIKEDLRTITDQEGNFAVDVPPGFYDLFFSSMSFSPSCRKVRVKADKPERVTVRLKVDPLVSKELAE